MKKITFDEIIEQIKGMDEDELIDATINIVNNRVEITRNCYYSFFLRKLIPFLESNNLGCFISGIEYNRTTLRIFHHDTSFT